MQLDEIRRCLAGRRAERIQPPGAKSAAVLIPLLEQDGEVSVLFERRSPDVRQGGEICFPGGRIERGGAHALPLCSAAGEKAQNPAPDSGTVLYERPEDAAARETAEELLISRDQIEIVAPMHCMAGPGGAEVTSFMGILHGYRKTFSAAEVAEVFSIPLSWFAAHPPQIHRARMRLETEEDFPWHLIPGGRNYPMRSVPRRFYFYETEYGVIWGMTAELLSHCLSVLKIL